MKRCIAGAADRKMYAATMPPKGSMIFCYLAGDSDAADTQADIDNAAGHSAAVSAGPEKVSTVMMKATHWEVDDAAQKAFQIYSRRPLFACSPP